MQLLLIEKAKQSDSEVSIAFVKRIIALHELHDEQYLRTVMP
jgi:hypothetical protein